MNAPLRTDALAAGTILRGRFELVEIIGSGGGSTVYRAIDRMRVLGQAPDPEVAIKLVSSEGSFGPWMVERVHREARYLRELRHPGIVEVFDSDHDGSFHFGVFELLKGRTVGQILRSAPSRTLPLDLVLRIVEGAAAGLRHAHECGILHGDFKPSNIFITLDGAVKLLDFGAAHGIDGSAPRDIAAMPEAFDAITPVYASLEMLLGERPGAGHDVYALAVVSYVMLTGGHPYGGRTALDAYQFGLRPARPPGLSKSRWEALARGLALESQGRTDDVAAFARGFARPLVWDRLLG